jgi:hypothetical protein
MNDEIFIAGFALMVACFLAWGFKALPAEKWQFIAAVPTRKLGGGLWSGMNLTYYGFFSATAYLVAVALLCVLLGAIGISAMTIFIMTMMMLIPCVPASRLTARWVEKKKYTFSVQGASFVGIIIAPWMVYAVNHWMAGYLAYRLDILVILSAVVISYSIGEGLGRLACISFGCCYGKPVHSLSPLMRKVFNRLYFVFRGSTKKIVYAEGLEGSPILPVQAITAIVLCATGIVGSYLFLKGYYAASFLGVVTLTQIWRFASEFVRADHRGKRKISAYQIMGLITILYCLGIILFFPMASTPVHNILDGFSVLWHPAVILFLQALWVVIFVYTGRSRVTSAYVSFRVVKENI